jgi:hypothetical protein
VWFPKVQHRSDREIWDLALWANTSEPVYNHELGDGQGIVSTPSAASQHLATLEVAQKEAVNKSKSGITLQYNDQLRWLRWICLYL